MGYDQIFVDDWLTHLLFISKRCSRQDK